MRRRTASRISLDCCAPSRRSPAVALTATGVQRRSGSGTVRTATSRSESRLCAASSGRPANADRPGCFCTNVSYSYVGDGPQLLNLYTWIREPVEPASIMSAYCTSGEDGLCGAVQKTVLLGSGSDSYELGRGAEGWGRVGASVSGLCGSIMGDEGGGRGGDSASTGPFQSASSVLGLHRKYPELTWGDSTIPDLFWIRGAQEPYKRNDEGETESDPPPRKIA